MPSKLLIVAQIGGEIPVMPTVVSTNSHFVTSRGGPRDTYRYCVCLTTRSSKSHHFSPRMNLNKLLCEINFLRVVQRRHIASINSLTHSVIYFGMAIAEGICTNPHDAHVGINIAVKVPDRATLRFTKIRRQLVRKEHLSPLREEHVATWNSFFCSLPKLLPCFHLDSFVSIYILVRLIQSSGHRAGLISNSSIQSRFGNSESLGAQAASISCVNCIELSAPTTTRSISGCPNTKPKQAWTGATLRSTSHLSQVAHKSDHAMNLEGRSSCPIKSSPCRNVDRVWTSTPSALSRRSHPELCKRRSTKLKGACTKSRENNGQIASSSRGEYTEMPIFCTNPLSFNS